MSNGRRFRPISVYETILPRRIPIQIHWLQWQYGVIHKDSHVDNNPSLVSSKVVIAMQVGCALSKITNQNLRLSSGVT